MSDDASINSCRVSMKGDYQRIYGDEPCGAAAISLVSRQTIFRDVDYR